MEALAGLIGALTALLVAATGAVPVLRRLWKRDDDTDKRLDLLWEAHMARGRAEASYKKMTVALPVGGGEDITAVLLRPEIRKAYEPIAPALRQLWREMRQTNKSVTSGQFAERVEKEYGPWIAKHICAVLGVSDYACLAMAQMIVEDTPNGHDPTECKEGPP